MVNCLTNYSTSQSQGGVGGDEEVGLGSGRGAGRAARRLGSCEPPAAPGFEKPLTRTHHSRSRSLALTHTYGVGGVGE